MPELCLRPEEFPGGFVPLPDEPRQFQPIDEVRVLGGFPSPVADYAEKRLDINEYVSWSVKSIVAIVFALGSYSRCFQRLG